MIHEWWYARPHLQHKTAGSVWSLVRHTSHVGTHVEQVHASDAALCFGDLRTHSECACDLHLSHVRKIGFDKSMEREQMKHFEVRRSRAPSEEPSGSS